MKEFNLSEKEVRAKGKGKVFMRKDVKEFIRLLKEEIMAWGGYDGNTDKMVEETIKDIDKLAGDKLTK